MSHLLGFGVENFRVFKRMTNFEFAPITFLTGPISSGKSSLIKSILLLKLNWFKREFNIPLKLDPQFCDLNIGPLTNALNKSSKSNRLRFSLLFPMKNFIKPINSVIEYENRFGIGVLQEGSPIFSIDNKPLHSLSYDFDLTFDFESLKKNILLNSPGKHEDEFVHGNRSCLNYSVFHNFFNLPDPYHDRNNPFVTLFDSRKFTSEINIREYLLSKDYFDEDIIIKLEVLYHRNEPWEIGNDKYLEIFQINNQPNYYYELHRAFIDMYDDIFSNLHYLPAIKGIQQRAFSSFDPQLGNILKSLTMSKLQGFVLDFINFWIKKFNIGKELRIKRNDTLDLNYISIDNNQSLVDMGLGCTQIVAIILMIAKIANQSNGIYYKLKLESPVPSILILEEPEANLHPAFQSQLAELFYDAATKFNIQFIIETHSEYLIRKIQYLTAKGDLTSRDSLIYYFDKPDSTGQPKGELQIKKIKILGNGSLSEEMGPGFFDEENDLPLDLMYFKRSQKN
ncbi:MAG: AAA family ATPase [Bacteroidales bacterium]|jgi:predicted ATPase